MARNFTQELLKAQSAGQRIVCSVAPYEDQPMEYKPRHGRDPLPWVAVGMSAETQKTWRYSGRECHAVDAPVFEQALKALTDYYAWYIGDTGSKPVLIKDWESDSGTTRTVLMWEEGPDDWTITVTHQEQPIEVLLPGWPVSVGCEPYNYWTMSIYLQD